MKILFKNAHLLCMDEEVTVRQNSDLLVEDQKIARIGKIDDVGCDRVIDATGKIVMPGLINTHTHVAMTLFRGTGDDLPLDKWLNEKIFPMEDRLDGNAVYLSSKLGMLEMLRRGTTAFADMYFFCDSIIKAAQEVGIRADIGRCIVGYGREASKRMEETEALFEQYESELIHVRPAPHAIYSCSQDALRKSARLAEKLNSGLHIHLAETHKEFDECVKENGITPTELLARCECLSGDTILAHSVYLTDEDVRQIKESGAIIALNTVSNLKLASGVARVPELMDCGVRLALGTDGVASNNSQNIFREMMMTALLHKGVRLEPTAVPAAEALRMATVNGAYAMRKEIGLLKEGSPADLIMVNMQELHCQPLNNAVSNLVYACTGEEVEITMVNGRILYEDGRFPFVDERELIAELDQVKNGVIFGG